MMDQSLPAFLMTAVAISLSGVMAPGPMTAMTIGRGSADGRAGITIALGHGIVELPLMAAVMAGAGFLFTLPFVKEGVGIGGALLMFVMAAGLLRSPGGRVEPSFAAPRSNLAAGIALSAGNPYFLIWWATVGASLIARAAVFGPLGLALFALVHWLCDAVWLTALAWLAARGSRSLGPRFHRGVSIISGAALFIFAGFFLWQSLAPLVAAAR